MSEIEQEDNNRWKTLLALLNEEETTALPKMKPPHECSKCTKTFTLKVDLIKHEKTHREKGIFICHECGKQCGNRYLLNRHLFTHTGERTLQCPECERVFFWKENLAQHMKCHMGDGPFECNACSEILPCKIRYRAHVRLHQKGKIPCKCARCGKLYARKSSLAEHSKKCKGIPKSTISVATETAPINVEPTSNIGHSQQYRCNQCKTEFTDSGVFALHKFYHTVLEGDSAVLPIPPSILPTTVAPDSATDTTRTPTPLDPSPIQMGASNAESSQLAVGPQGCTIS